MCISKHFVSEFFFFHLHFRRENEKVLQLDFENLKMDIVDNLI